MKNFKCLIFTFICCCTISSMHAQQWLSPSNVTFQSITTYDVLIGGDFMSGDGIKCLWNNEKSAFRGGELEDQPSNWNQSSLGSHSFSFGYDTKANGLSSVSFGYMSEASNYVALAFGNETLASGNRSTAFGINTIASGHTSTALGIETEASGDYSTALGIETEAGQLPSEKTL